MVGDNAMFQREMCLSKEGFYEVPWTVQKDLKGRNQSMPGEQESYTLRSRAVGLRYTALLCVC